MLCSFPHSHTSTSFVLLLLHTAIRLAIVSFIITCLLFKGCTIGSELQTFFSSLFPSLYSLAQTSLRFPPSST